MIRVLVVDDHELSRRSYRMLFGVEPDIDVVGEAADGLAAVEQAHRLRPDVVLMDIRMPRLDGVEATRRIMALPDPPHVLVLTTYDTDDNVVEALQAGASGFLLKDVSAEQLVDGVRVVAAGDALLAPAVTRRVIARAVAATGPRPPTDLLAQLTDREAEVFLLVADGLSNHEIARRLTVTEGTVKTHVSRLLAKLGLRSRAQAVALAHRNRLR